MNVIILIRITVNVCNAVHALFLLINCKSKSDVALSEKGIFWNSELFILRLI